MIEIVHRSLICTDSVALDDEILNFEIMLCWNETCRDLEMG